MYWLMFKETLGKTCQQQHKHRDRNILSILRITQEIGLPNDWFSELLVLQQTRGIS